MGRCLQTPGDRPPPLTTSMRQMVVSTSLGWETMTSEVANTFTSAWSFCSVTKGGFGTWILMVRGRDSGYCWNTCGQTPGGVSRAIHGGGGTQGVISQPLSTQQRVPHWIPSESAILLESYKPHAKPPSMKEAFPSTAAHPWGRPAAQGKKGGQGLCMSKPCSQTP